MMVEKALFHGNNTIVLIFLGVLFLALTIIRIIILRPLCQPTMPANDSYEKK